MSNRRGSFRRQGSNLDSASSQSVLWSRSKKRKFVRSIVSTLIVFCLLLDGMGVSRFAAARQKQSKMENAKTTENESERMKREKRKRRKNENESIMKDTKREGDLRKSCR